MKKQKMVDPYEYEQSIEDDMDSYIRLDPEEEKKAIASLIEIAKSHVAAKASEQNYKD